MGDDIFLLLGGIGMFLLGMEFMTAALRDATGSNLRGLLARFTTTPLRGVVTGATATAMIQSSSATTVMTVGFVGAGLMTLGQALGVIYGANIGTTATGWLVSLLGFKLKLGELAMAGMLPAALAAVLGRGAAALVGRVVSGLFLLLIGLELMQMAMGDVAGVLTPDMLPGGGVLGALALTGIGLGLTIIMQSSSAAMALALVMLQAGALSLTQAAMIVIGMNIGTTFTAILASLGGGRSMRQAALANLVFNVVTSLLAFPMLVLFQDRLIALAGASDAMTALLVFHTGFNLVGTLLFLPLTAGFAAVIVRLIPDRKPEALVHFDRTLLRDAPTALLSAHTGLGVISDRLYRALGQALSPEPDYRGLSTLVACDEALTETRDFLTEIRLPHARAADQAVFSDLLHEIDHLMRLSERAKQSAAIDILLTDPASRRPALVVGAALMGHDQDGAPARFARLHQLVESRRHRQRSALLASGGGNTPLSGVFAQTDAMRWLTRVLHHVEKASAYHHEAGRHLPGTDLQPAQAAGQAEIRNETANEVETR